MNKNPSTNNKTNKTNASGKTLDEVKAIKKRFIAEKWTGDCGIVGVGIGQDDQGNYCLQVRLDKEEKRKDIPGDYDGVTVVVVEVGSITAL